MLHNFWRRSIKKKLSLEQHAQAHVDSLLSFLALIVVGDVWARYLRMPRVRVAGGSRCRLTGSGVACGLAAVVGVQVEHHPGSDV